LIINELSNSFRIAANDFAHWNFMNSDERPGFPHCGTTFSRVKNGGGRAVVVAWRRGWQRVHVRCRRTTGKKKPADERAESIFLEEDRGDRNHHAAMHKFRPMMFRDGSHPLGA
jgi:hypothetical protein